MPCWVPSTLDPECPWQLRISPLALGERLTTDQAKVITHAYISIYISVGTGFKGNSTVVFIEGTTSN
jgi:hypothetical protein